ncbi:class I SAM-dependent methyltransferase [Rhizobium sp. CSW-27]|uniref:class I SAM-dependent methyltransferase n=1 Tax=Rhizobium sp. CSW-27 TaxID=2839985 RepID=UPI001C00BCDC|nr:class I SAM-dependent methyltransferase [Rhizobium sp. CSW-27]MBT9370037.1 class I SAM-dependent methyltransferase [Rhizobium sp. CSW-27]
MYNGAFKNIYHYHLKKCGGTYLNTWIYQNAPDGQVWDDVDADVAITGLSDADKEKKLAQMCFVGRNIVCTHRPLIGYIPERTFSFTVLRDPVRRLVSQFADWRREAGRDHRTNEEILIGIRDAGSLSLRQYLIKHGRGPLRGLFENYQVRALASSLDNSFWYTDYDAGILNQALSNIAENFHFVGISESMEQSISVVCSRLGICPPARDGARLNEATKTYVSESEIAEAMDILEELTAGDRILYDKKLKDFQSLDSREKAFSVEDFEEIEAAQSVKKLAAEMSETGGGGALSVRGTLFASGIHGRDGARTNTCAVWTGPSATTTLFFPVPKGEQLTFKLWIRGYASEEIRDALKLTINGIAAEPRFEPEPGYRECLYADFASDREFAKVVLQTGNSYASEADSRRRGISFDQYGWLRRKVSGDDEAMKIGAAMRDVSGDTQYFSRLSETLQNLSEPRRKAVMVHVDYLAQKAGTSSLSILNGDSFSVNPQVHEDAKKNIDSELSHSDGVGVSASAASVSEVVNRSQKELQGWCSDEKANYIVDVILELKPEVCVEIGVYGGRSLVPAAAALRANQKGVIYGIETWSPQVAVEYKTTVVNDEWWLKVDFSKIKSSFLKFIVENGLSDFVKLIELPSASASTAFTEIDYLHIDGAHSVFNAAEDVVLYAKKVRKGGVIIMDDANWKTTESAVRILDSLGERLKTFVNENGAVSCIVYMRK